MIKTYKDKKLKKLLEEGDARGIPKDLERKLKVRLEVIDSAADINDMRLPGYHLHELDGNKKGTWSIKISANWRVTFRFEKGDAYDLNFEDYH